MTTSIPKHRLRLTALFGLLAILAASAAWLDALTEPTLNAQAAAGVKTVADLPADVRIIGPTAEVTLSEPDRQHEAVEFLARVDTGAKSCSLHSSKWIVEGESPVMEENLGKPIRFELENRRGETVWLERTIAEVAEVRTSERAEKRYKIPMLVACQGVVREVLVSLNDRSQMAYAMLLGRNYLDGAFLVDVSGADVPEKELLAGGRVR